MMQQQQMRMAMMGVSSSNNMGGMATGIAGMSPQQMGGMNMNIGMGTSMGHEMAQAGMASPAIVQTNNSKKGNTNEDVSQSTNMFQQTPLYNPAFFMGMTPQQAGDNNIYGSDSSNHDHEDDVDWSDSDGEELSSDEEEDETLSGDGNR